METPATNAKRITIASYSKQFFQIEKIGQIIKIGLFAKIRPGEILFSPTRRRKLSTFYFFEIHMKEHERILAMNYF